MKRHSAANRLCRWSAAALALGCTHHAYLELEVGFPKNGPAQLPALVEALDLVVFDAAGDAGPVRLPTPLQPMAFSDGGRIVLQGVPNTSVTILMNGVAADGTTVLASFSDTVTLTAGTTSLPALLSPHCETSTDCDPDTYCAGLVTCQGQVGLHFGACLTAPAGTARPDGLSCGDCAGYCDAGGCYLPTCGCASPLPDGGLGYVIDPSVGQVCNSPDNDDFDAGACRTNCQPAHCGDGVVDPGERCDLGPNNGLGLGCNATCDLLGLVTTLAGDGGNGLVDGVGPQARFANPYGMALVGNQLYVADVTFGAVRAIELTTHQVSTVAGGHGCVDADGPATDPDAGVCAGSGPTALIPFDGGLLVADDGALRWLSLSDTQDGGPLTTFAGQPAFDGEGVAFFDAGPLPLSACSYDGTDGLVQVGSDLFTNLQFTGQITVSDLTTQTYRAIGESIGTTEQGGMTTLNGIVYSTATFSQSILAYDAVDTDAGVSVISPLYQGFSLKSPNGICADGKHSLYLCDGQLNQIFQYDLDTGTTTLLAGSPNLVAAQPDGLGVDAGFFEPNACVYDPVAEVLYVSDYAGNLIRKIE